MKHSASISVYFVCLFFFFSLLLQPDGSAWISDVKIQVKPITLNVYLQSTHDNNNNNNSIAAG